MKLTRGLVEQAGGHQYQLGSGKLIEEEEMTSDGHENGLGGSHKKIGEYANANGIMTGRIR